MTNRFNIIASIGASVVLVVQLAHSPSTFAQSTLYGLEDLGVLPDDRSSVPYGLNEFGGVVGWSTGSTSRPFIFTDESGMTELPLPADVSNGAAYDVNDAGQVAGSVGLLGERAVRWTGGVLEELSLLGATAPSNARGISAFGDTVGFFTLPDATFGQAAHAYILTDAAGFRDIGPDGARSFAYDINDAGQVTGYFSFGADRAFRWSASGGLEDLGVVGDFAHSFGFAINETGQVAGHLTSASGNAERLFRYTDGRGMEILGGAGEVNRAWGINNLGDVVGEGRPTASGLVRGVIYTDNGGLQALNDLLDPALNWSVLLATDINDVGNIAATAINNDTGDIHAVRLVPIDTVLAPVAPSNLIAAGIGPNRIDLSWADNSANEEGFDLERREAGGVFARLAIPAQDTTNFIDHGVQPNTTYEYRIRAFNVAGSSSFSNIATATTPSSDTVAPQVSFLNPVDGGKVAGRERIEIAASDNVGVTRIEFLVDGALTCTSQSSPLICEWDTRGLARGLYTLTGRAFDAAGNSGQSIIVTARGGAKSGS